MIEYDRVLRTHRCSRDRSQCEDPGAHFQGSDAEWDLFVRMARDPGGWFSHEEWETFFRITEKK